MCRQVLSIISTGGYVVLCVVAFYVGYIPLLTLEIFCDAYHRLSRHVVHAMIFVTVALGIAGLVLEWYGTTVGWLGCTVLGCAWGLIQTARDKAAYARYAREHNLTKLSPAQIERFRAEQRMLTADAIALAIAYRQPHVGSNAERVYLAKLEQRLRQPTSEVDWTTQQAINWLNAFDSEVNELLRLNSIIVSRKKYTTL